MERDCTSNCGNVNTIIEWHTFLYVQMYICVHPVRQTACWDVAERTG